jgi:hypothetical protein
MIKDENASQSGTLSAFGPENPDHRSEESRATPPWFNARIVVLFVIILVIGLVIVDLWPMLIIEQRRREFLDIVQKGMSQSEVRAELARHGFYHNGGSATAEYNIHTREPVCITVTVKVVSLYYGPYGTRIWLTACDVGAVVLGPRGKVDHGSLASKWLVY